MGTDMRRLQFTEAVLLILHQLATLAPVSSEREILQKRLRLETSPDLGHPEADVLAFQGPGWDSSRAPQAALVTGLPGLLGACSPMPGDTLERLLQEYLEDSRATALLTSIQHHLLTLLFLGWYRLHPELSLAPASPGPLARCLARLWGDDDPARAFVEPDAFSVGPLLLEGTRSATGLTAYLETSLGVPIIIRQHPLRIIDLATHLRPKLGAHHFALQLGRNAVLGRRSFDRMNTLYLEIGPLTDEDANSFEPGQSLHLKLLAGCRRFLQRPMDLLLALRLETRPRACLAHETDRRMPLNRRGQLGRGSTGEAIHTTFMPAEAWWQQGVKIQQAEGSLER